MVIDITLPLRKGRGGISKEWKAKYIESLQSFANDMIRIQEGIDFPISARGWCYAMEPYGLSKGDFNYAQEQINRARREGFLEPGFILEEDGHVVTAMSDFDWSPEDWVNDEFETWKTAKETFETCDERFGASSISFWDDKEYFIQLLVEKSDLKSLFRKVCDKYKIPFANMRGWGSIEQKANMAKRFHEAEDEGKQAVLFVCCDFDPPGIGISNSLMNTFRDLSKFSGWNPEGLIIERIGLNYDFIQENKLSWIEGLRTINNKDLADPTHKFYISNIYDIRGYIKKYGARKCEANALVVAPEMGRQLLIDKIHEYLGDDCYTKFVAKIRRRKAKAKELVQEKLDEEDEE